MNIQAALSFLVWFRYAKTAIAGTKIELSSLVFTIEHFASNSAIIAYNILTIKFGNLFPYFRRIHEKVLFKS